MFQVDALHKEATKKKEAEEKKKEVDSFATPVQEELYMNTLPQIGYYPDPNQMGGMMGGMGGMPGMMPGVGGMPGMQGGFGF